MTSSKSRKVRRRRRRKQQNRFESLKRKLKQSPFREDKILIEPDGKAKMSKVLADFVEPYLELVDTGDANRKLLTLAVLAWNASFLPQEEQQAMIDEVLDAGLPAADEELKAGLKEIVNMLIVRKKIYFSDYTRRIIDFELTDRGKDYHLSVASTL